MSAIPPPPQGAQQACGWLCAEAHASEITRAPACVADPAFPALGSEHTPLFLNTLPAQAILAKHLPPLTNYVLFCRLSGLQVCACGSWVQWCG